MFGLGHYIYAGEDLPPNSDPPSEPKPEKKPAKKKEPAQKVTPIKQEEVAEQAQPPENHICLLYTSPSPRDGLLSRMPSSA